MRRLFQNRNGNNYCILFGSKGGPALLINMSEDKYVVVAILQDYDWWQGNYFNNFEDAYEFWNKRYKKESPVAKPNDSL